MGAGDRIVGRGASDHILDHRRVAAERETARRGGCLDFDVRKRAGVKQEGAVRAGIGNGLVERDHRPRLAGHPVDAPRRGLDHVVGRIAGIAVEVARGIRIGAGQDDRLVGGHDVRSPRRSPDAAVGPARAEAFGVGGGAAGGGVTLDRPGAAGAEHGDHRRGDGRERADSSQNSQHCSPFRALVPSRHGTPSLTLGQTALDGPRGHQPSVQPCSVTRRSSVSSRTA